MTSAAILSLLASPDIALFTLLAGILLIYLECNRPGLIVPGCLGGLVLMLSLFRLHQLPLRPSALALLGFGLAVLLLELAVPARNLLAALGMAAIACGLATLVQPFAPAHVHIASAIAVAAGFGVPTLWLSRVALRARRNKRTLRHPAAVQDRLNQSSCLR
jgi:membrane-bound serine protease (ClpP class)